MDVDVYYDVKWSVFSEAPKVHSDNAVAYVFLVSTANLNEWDYVAGLSQLLVTRHTARVFRLISYHRWLQNVMQVLVVQQWLTSLQVSAGSST
jgi:histidinol dehydrogenase